MPTGLAGSLDSHRYQQVRMIRIMAALGSRMASACRMERMSWTARAGKTGGNSYLVSIEQLGDEYDEGLQHESFRAQRQHDCLRAHARTAWMSGWRTQLVTWSLEKGFSSPLERMSGAGVLPGSSASASVESVPMERSRPSLAINMGDQTAAAAQAREREREGPIQNTRCIDRRL